MRMSWNKWVCLLLVFLGAACQQKPKTEATATEKSTVVDRTQVVHRTWLPREAKHIAQLVVDTNEDIWLVTTDEQLVRAQRDQPPAVVDVRLGRETVDVSWVGVLGDQLWVVASHGGRSLAGMVQRETGAMTVLDLPHEPRELAWSQGVLWYLSTDAFLYRHKAGKSERTEAQKYLFLLGAKRTLIARELEEQRLMARQAKTGKWGPIHDFGGVPVGLGPDDAVVQWVRGEESEDETLPQNRLVMSGTDLLSGTIQAAAATANVLAVVRVDGTRPVLEWREYRL